MDTNLPDAIISFIANEFKLEPDGINPDLNFESDLGLDQNGIDDLLSRLQEALDFTLPKDNVSDIHTLEDLFRSIDPDLEPSEEL